MVMTIKHGTSKKKIIDLLKKLENKSSKGVDVKKFSGKIKLNKSPLDIQKDIRNEWD